MRNLILLLIFWSGTALFCNQTLLLKYCDSDSVDPEILKSIDMEIYKAISSYLELGIIFSENEGSPDFFADLTLNTRGNKYELHIKVIKTSDNSTLLEKLFLRDSIKNFSSDIEAIVLDIREKLRYRPNHNSKSQIVVETSIPHADIYIDNEFIGTTPVVIRKKIGDCFEIEARTESWKKRIEFEVTTLKIEKITLEMEPIVGSMLLRGDLAGRTLVINGEEVDLNKTALFKGLEIGTYDLYIESEWGFWEKSVIILEDTLIELNVDFSPISRVEIALNKNDKILVFDSNNVLLEEIIKDGTYIFPLGRYRFENIRKGFISLKEEKDLETEYLNSYISPELYPLISPEEIKREEEAAFDLLFNNKLSKVKEGSLYGSLGVCGLLLAGIIGEIVTINLYNQSNITSDAVEYREIGEGLRGLNIIFLSVGILGAGTYFGVDLFRKEVPSD